MSLDLVRKNSSSPFHLQRSIVDQGGAGGAYEQGGFNPEAVYNNDLANEAIASFGKIVGAGLMAMDKKEKIKKPELPKDDSAEAAATFENYKKEENSKQEANSNLMGSIVKNYNSSKKITKR